MVNQNQHFHQDQTIVNLDPHIVQLNQTIVNIDQHIIQLDQTILNLDQHIIQLDQTIVNLRQHIDQTIANMSLSQINMKIIGIFIPMDQDTQDKITEEQDLLDLLDLQFIHGKNLCRAGQFPFRINKHSEDDKSLMKVHCTLDHMLSKKHM